MNTTTAACGHPTTAVGMPGSIARQRCEAEVCGECKQPSHYVRESVRTFYWVIWNTSAYPERGHCWHVWTLNPNVDEAERKHYSESGSRKAPGIYLIFCDELGTGKAITHTRY